MKTRLVYFVVGLSVMGPVFANEADIAAYEKEYFSEDMDAPTNEHFISAYARARANRAARRKLSAELVAKPGIERYRSGDTAVGGLIIQPGADLKNVRTITVINNKARNVVVTK